jgi:predicted RNA polymerase sigma factor
MSRRFPDAAQAYEAAIERTGNARQRDFLQRSLEALTQA